MEHVINVQDVFNKVIDSGCYWRAVNSGCGMCLALLRARDTHIISGEEAYAAQRAIAGYMGLTSNGWSYLASALMDRMATADEFKVMYEDTLTIYRDWENRPMELPLAKYKENQP